MTPLRNRDGNAFIPTPPSLYDFASTTQYFKMVKRVIQSITPDKKFDFIKVMPTKVERNKARQMDFLDIMRDRFGLTMLRSIFSSTSAIPNAASVYKTLYDLPKGERDNSVIDMLDEVFSEIEALIRKSWEEGRRPASSAESRRDIRCALPLRPESEGAR